MACTTISAISEETFNAWRIPAQEAHSEQATPRRLSTTLRRASAAFQAGSRGSHAHPQHRTRFADEEGHGAGSSPQQEEEEEREDLLGGELLVRVEDAHVRTQLYYSSPLLLVLTATSCARNAAEKLSRSPAAT